MRPVTPSHTSNCNDLSNDLSDNLSGAIISALPSPNRYGAEQRSSFIDFFLESTRIGSYHFLNCAALPQGHKRRSFLTQISRFLPALTPLGLPPEALTFLFDHAFLQFLKQWRRRPEFLSDRNRRRLPAIDPAVGARQHQPLPAVRIDNLLDLWRRGDQVFVPEQSV